MTNALWQDVTVPNPLVLYAVELMPELVLVKKSSSATLDLETEASSVPITRWCGLMLKPVALESLMIPDLITKLTTGFII